MDFYNIIAEIFGFAASFFLLYSATRTTDKDLITLQGVSNGLWIIHYFLFNAYTGVIACALGLLRNAFVFKWNSYKAKMGYVVLFGSFCVGQLFYIENLINATPIIAIFIISYGVLFSEKNKLTSYLLIGNALLLAFSISISSISGTFNYVAMLMLLGYRWVKLTRINASPSD